MLWMLLTGIRPFVDRLQPCDTHQTAHTVAFHMGPASRQVGRNLATRKERLFREDPLDLIHQFQHFNILFPRSASSATVALNLSEKLRVLVISVSCLQGWIHFSTLFSFAGPLQSRAVMPHKRWYQSFGYIVGRIPHFVQTANAFVKATAYAIRPPRSTRGGRTFDIGGCAASIR